MDSCQDGWFVNLDLHAVSREESYRPAPGDGDASGRSRGRQCNIKALLRRGRGYKDLRYLLLKAQRMADSRLKSLFFRKQA
jgi:hypothetical protein